MDPGVARDAVTAVLGLAMGILSGLFGVGGGVISQPGMRLLGLEPLMVIGTALPVIVPGALSGTVRYARERMVRWDVIAATVPPGLAMALVGAAVAEDVPGDGHLLQLVTAGLLALSAYRMSRMPPLPRELHELAESDAPEAPLRPHPLPVGQQAPRWRFVAIGVIAGALSGLLGIGGGVIMVPAFVQLAGIDVKRAIATSLVCVGLFAVPGTLAHGLQDHVAWGTAAALGVGVIPGARIGAALTMRATDRRLRIAVGSFLGLTAVLYGAGELCALLG